MSRKVKGKRTSKGGTAKGLQGRRFTPEQKKTALALVAGGRLARSAIATLMHTTPESLRRWVREAEQADGGKKQCEPAQLLSELEAGLGQAAAAAVAAENKGTSGNAKRSLYAPHDPGQGLGEHEVAAILELKRKHPSMGPAQLRAQLKRFKGWRLSNKAIARVLKREGYQLVHTSGRPEGPEPRRFEAPRRNALWQADFTEVRVGAEKLSVLIILDDFSRFVVGHALGDSPTSEVATRTLMAAIARHGKPEAVRTDRGGAFVASSEPTDFAHYLEAELIDHVVGHAYNPKGGGKVESAIGTLKRELWQVFEFHSRDDAAGRLALFFAEYNEQRAHMGIDGLTPADRFFGRADKVLASIDAVSRRRQGAQALLAPAGATIEEVGTAAAGVPMEVLRLVLVDWQMELRFCGARVALGAVDK